MNMVNVNMKISTKLFRKMFLHNVFILIIVAFESLYFTK